MLAATTSFFPEACISQSLKETSSENISDRESISLLEKIYTNASIARADLDSTKKKREWSETIENFNNNKINILVGTQTITKGYHFKNVTLVGILWADLNLHFPAYNSTEVTLQQILQVAGRAGRENNDSEVIIQTLTDHYIFNHLEETSYLSFYKLEILQRKKMGYPPYSRFIEIEIKNTNLSILEKETEFIFENLIKINKQNNLDVKILGPVKPAISKIKNWNINKVYLKSDNINQIIKLFKFIDQKSFKSLIFFGPS